MAINYLTHGQQSDDFYFIPSKTFAEYSPATAPLGDLRRHYYQLEDIFIKLLQNREYSLSQRLIDLGRVVDSFAYPPNTAYSFNKALEMVRSKVLALSHEEYRKKLDGYYDSGNDAINGILENYLVNFILTKDFFFRAPPLAYYKMAFSYAVSIVFALGYCIMTDQPINQQIMLQAIGDVENIFYQEWFYRHATALQANTAMHGLWGIVLRSYIFD